MFVVLIRTLLLYALIIFSIRIMGKRQIGELQPSELVVTIMISNIATLPIEDTNIPLLAGITPIIALVSIEVIISAVTLKSIKARTMVSGTPRVVICNGQVNQNELKKLRFSVDDLMEALRAKDVFDLDKVETAIVETTGKLNVYLKASEQPVTPATMNLQTEEKGPHFIIIHDGSVMKESLNHVQKSDKWLQSILKKEKRELKNVFILTANRCGDYILIPKQQKTSKEK